MKKRRSKAGETLVETLTNWRVQPNGTEGYRTAEIASVVGIGEGSVRSSLARSRRRIKKILEKEGVEIEV